jgi:hypothetical protein
MQSQGPRLSSSPAAGTQAGGTLNFPSISTDADGSTLQTINVGLVDDGSAELDENMSVTLSNARDSATDTPLVAGHQHPVRVHADDPG